MLGLRFCARAFSSCGKRGPLLIVVRRPLTVAASLVVEHRLQTRRLSNRGPRAQVLRGTWDPPRPGLKPVSPAPAGRPSTTAPPGKPCLFILLTVSFAVQKLLSLSRSHLFIFAFVLFALGDRSKKILLWFMLKSVLSMFSSRNFMVSELKFMSLIHFEFTLVYGVRKCSNFNFLHVAVQFPQHCLLRRLSFFHCIFLPPLLYINWP